MRNAVELTPAEKAAGRAFRDRMQAADAPQLAAADMVVPVYLAVLRHKCPGRGDISTSLDLIEHYIRSPRDGQVPAGRFAWIFRDGSCRRCGLTARTPGRLVAADSRPPLREPHMTRNEHPNNTGESRQQENLQQQANPQDSPSVRAVDSAGPTYKHPDGINDPVDPEHNNPAEDPEARRQADER